MATTGIINGHNLRWFLAGVAIAKATTGSISFDKETREISHKDQANSWSQVIGGRKSFNGSCEAYLAEGESFESLWAAYEADTILTMEFSTDVSGDKFFDCQCKITNLEVNAEDNEEVTYSVSFSGYGQPTRSTVA